MYKHLKAADHMMIMLVMTSIMDVKEIVDVYEQKKWGLHTYIIRHLTC